VNPSATTYLLYVGTRTIGDSKGIYVYSYDANSGKPRSLGLAAATLSPTFLAVGQSERTLYSVNEVSDYNGGSTGAITAFAINRATGQLSTINQLASRGADPCYLSLDKTGKYALVANYSGGSVAVFPLLENGGLAEATAFIQHAGIGKNLEPQARAHPHWIETTSDNRFALVADLGLDKIFVYRFDPDRGQIAPNTPPFVELEAGAGPRHITPHPNGKLLYVINELASTVTVVSLDSSSGSLIALQTISSLPPGFSGPNDAAEIHIHPSGKFLFASNRGHDSIGIFSIAPATGNLALIGHVPTQGRTPRNFEFDPTGSRLLVANQDSDNIVVFEIDGQTGGLTATGQQLAVPCPVSLGFVATR
jgi:6-phosphogluconolactonase